ncbi:MAG: MarR family transcriptional regulator [Clostridiales bacterium]|nr:MarR family transcriptional regulator [Clostridiales bacterium]
MKINVNKTQGISAENPPSAKVCCEHASPMMLIRDVNKMCDDYIRKHTQANMQDSFRNLLFHLNFNDGCTQLTLANLTHLKAPTVSVTLQKMEREGYVIRKPNKNDLRQTLVYITEKGKQYNKHMYETIRAIDSAIFEGVSEEDQKQMCDILRKVIANLMKEINSDT